MPGSNSQPTALLLLPAPTAPGSLRPLYAASLSKILPVVAGPVKGSNHNARLDIAILLPKTFSTRISPRAMVFNRASDLLKDMYALVGELAKDAGVAIDSPGGVDPRIFMLEDQTGFPDDRPVMNHSLSGPIVDLPILVSSGRNYDPVFSVDTDEGEDVLNQFLHVYGLKNWNKPNVRKTPGGHFEKPKQKPKNIPEWRKTQQRHKSVAVGGVFDQLQASEKVMLTAAALVLEPENDDILSPTPRSVTIGIPSNEVLNGKRVEPWETRQKRAAEFFESIVTFSEENFRTEELINKPFGPNGKLVRVKLGPSLTVNYVQISDQFGPTVTDHDLSAIVMPRGADSKTVNKQREQKGLPTLEVFEVDAASH